MFSDHFQNIFYLYSLTEDVVASRNDCYRVVPHKVSTIEGIDWIGTSQRMNCLQSLALCRLVHIDGLPCEFYKAMWNTIGDAFSYMDA